MIVVGCSWIAGSNSLFSSETKLWIFIEFNKFSLKLISLILNLILSILCWEKINLVVLNCSIVTWFCKKTQFWLIIFVNTARLVSGKRIQNFWKFSGRGWVSQNLRPGCKPSQNSFNIFYLFYQFLDEFSRKKGFDEPKSSFKSTIGLVFQKSGQVYSERSYIKLDGPEESKLKIGESWRSELGRPIGQTWTVPNK